MDKNILYLAQDEIRHLAKDADYKLVLLKNHEDNIIIRDGRTEQMHHACAISLAINIIIDGRDGFFYTNNLTSPAITSFIQHSIETTRLLTPDESLTLADPSRYYRGEGPALHNFDATLNIIDPKTKIQITKKNNDEIREKDSRIISIQSRYADRQHQAYYLISNGFFGYEESSRCNLTTICTIDGENGQHPMDGWGETRIFFNDIPQSGIAKEALRRTINKIGQRPTSSGQYRMILESPIAGSFLQPILNAMSGQALQQRTSFLENKIESLVTSSLLTIIDDPLIPGTRGASHFDYDGVATSRRTIIENGVLKTYFIDTKYSHKLGVKPTTQGIHHLIVNQGDKTLSQIIEDSDKAILITDFNGGNCDPATGNFSYGIEGFLIQHGEIIHPISGMNITGNMLDVWSRLSELANDADPWETELIPSLVFEDVIFGGK